jgi:BirA family biotin operon repressor/biotin-[acetyl-CoA-carboxylase] ligase
MLWDRLRNRQFEFKFRRQEDMEKAIPDFVCYERRVWVELDGSQHLGSEKDKARDQFYTEQGWLVLRFWNHEVRNNLEGVIETIYNACASRPPYRIPKKPTN